MGIKTLTEKQDQSLSLKISEKQKYLNLLEIPADYRAFLLKKMKRKTYILNKCCANNHEWSILTTRWRIRKRTRTYTGKVYESIERDCKICKRIQQRKQRAKVRNWRTK